MPSRLSRLVNRNARISLAFLLLFVVTGVGTISALLYTRVRIIHSYRVMQLTAQIRQSADRTFLDLNADLGMSDRAAAGHDWTASVAQARRQLDTLRHMTRRDSAQKQRVMRVQRLLSQETDAATLLLVAQRDVALNQLANGRFAQLHTDLTRTLQQIASAEEAHLFDRRAHSQWGLIIFGAILAGFAALGLFAVLRTRRAARGLVADVEAAHRSMATSQAEMASLSEASPMGLLHADARGNATYLNARAREIFGAREDEDYMAVWKAAVHPEDRDRVNVAWQRMADGHEDVSGVYRLVRPDNQVAWLSMHMTAVRSDGALTGFVGFVADITTEHQLRETLAHSRTRLQQMTDAVPALMAYIDRNEIYQFVNGTYATWFGIENAPRVGDTLHGFLHDEAYARIRPHKDKALAGESTHFDIRQRKLHGRPFWAHVIYTPDIAPDGTVDGFHVLVTDLSKRKQLEERLFESRERAQVTLEAIGDAVVTTDAAGRVTFMNPRAEALLECTQADADGRPVDEIIHIEDSEGHRGATSLRRAIAEDRTVDTLQSRKLVLTNGPRLDIEDVAAPIHDRDGAVIGGVLVLRDVSVAQAIADRMRRLAEYDALTGLPNRMLFEDRALQAIHHAMRHEHKVGVLFLDLDGFKGVNDTFGHEAGDELLKQVATRLSGLLRRSDSVSRLGGDEFVILMHELHAASDAMHLADKLVEAGKRPFRHDGHRLDVTFSVGIALYPDHGADVHKLLRESDRALYSAKLAGKACHVMARSTNDASPDAARAPDRS